MNTHLSIGLLRAQFVLFALHSEKHTENIEFVTNHDFDLFVISETCLNKTKIVFVLT